MNAGTMVVEETKTLDQLISLLATGALPTAVRRKSFIVNDVPKSFPITTDENTLATILGGMLHSVVNQSMSSCIRVAATQSGSKVLIQMHDSSIRNVHALISQLQEVQPLADTIGGLFSIGEYEKTGAVGFSFMNLNSVA
ncbi:MAG TPA: hypothetical protein VLJ68_11015 [Chitinophagaceae bacterium]|nr:hypothetical protein [Chitinophagaceae bacterium]